MLVRGVLPWLLCHRSAHRTRSALDHLLHLFGIVDLTGPLIRPESPCAGSELMAWCGRIVGKQGVVNSWCVVRGAAVRHSGHWARGIIDEKGQDGQAVSMNARCGGEQLTESRWKQAESWLVATSAKWDEQ